MRSDSTPPKIIAASRPLPIGSASFQSLAGWRYQSRISAGAGSIVFFRGGGRFFFVCPNEFVGILKPINPNSRKPAVIFFKVTCIFFLFIFYVTPASCWLSGRHLACRLVKRSPRYLHRKMKARCLHDSQQDAGV